MLQTLNALTLSRLDITVVGKSKSSSVPSNKIVGLPFASVSSTPLLAIIGCSPVVDCGAFLELPLWSYQVVTVAHARRHLFLLSQNF